MSFFRCFIATLLLSSLLLNNSANAQVNVISVFEKDRPEYKAEGAKIRAFRLKPTLSLVEKFDDNIYSTNSGETSDSITVISPDIRLESDWSRHALDFHANGDFGIYNDKTSENFDDYSAGVNLRLDAFRETFITAGLDFQKKHEDRGSPDNNSSSVEPTEYNELTGKVGFYRGLRKLSMKVDGEVTTLNFDNGLTAANAVINNDNRDRNQYKSSVRLGYEFMPDYQAFVKGTYNARSYDNTATLDRNSDGLEFTVGTSVNLGGKSKGEVFVGYMQQKYDAATLEDIDGISFGANILWNATKLTSVRTSIDRSIEETSTTTSSGYIATVYSVALEHELMRNVLIGSKIGFATNDYVSLTAIERNDDILMAAAQATYLINRNVGFNVKYTHQDRDSNIANQDYTKNIISIGLTAGF